MCHTATMPRARLDDLVADVRSAAGLDGAFGAVVSEPTGAYRIDRFSGTNLDSLQDVRVPTGAGIGGKAMLLGKPQTVSEYVSARAITHDFDEPVADAGLRSMFAIPVLVDGSPRAMLYGAMRTPAAISDRRLDLAYRLVNQYRFDLRVDDDVARRLAELDTAATTNATAETTRMRQQLRDIHAEARTLAAQVDDPDLAARIEDLSRRALPQQQRQQHEVVSERELDVIAHVADGLSNADVAQRLGLATSTVKSYLKNAMRKTGVGNRTALVAACRNAGQLP